MEDFGLYIVMTAPELGYQEFTRICVEAEVPMLQLRDKRMGDRELLLLASTLAEQTRGSKTRFIINERIDICLLSGADGVHFGPDDLSWQEARKLLPKSCLVGISTHSLEQAQQAQNDAAINPWGISYMSFGPIYPTVAKAIPDPPVGSENLRKVLKNDTLPVVAIGGIFSHNLPEVLSTGARNVCMIRQFGQARTESELRQRINTTKQQLMEVNK
ncbi:MAG: thiamine phosphate synthase [Candidatus Cloacimonetes bacterium]|nr:thiamine phosphate synthase [Candidatus Cloacimonadota bacterium]